MRAWDVSGYSSHPFIQKEKKGLRITRVELPRNSICLSELPVGHITVCNISKVTVQYFLLYCWSSVVGIFCRMCFSYVHKRLLRLHIAFINHCQQPEDLYSYVVLSCLTKCQQYVNEKLLSLYVSESHLEDRLETF